MEPGKATVKFPAEIRTGERGKKRSLGCFEKEEEAAQAYRAAKEES